MADKETPAYIDYSGEEDKPSARKYWQQQLVQIHRMSVGNWSIKNLTLWKRIESEFAYEDLKRMIDHWMSTSTQPHNFTKFYVKRLDIQKEVFKDYEWD